MIYKKLPCFICKKEGYTILFFNKKGNPYVICEKHLREIEKFVLKLKVSGKPSDNTAKQKESR